MAVLLRRRTAFSLIALLLAGIAGWHYFTLYRSFGDAREHLSAARQRLAARGLDVTAADITASNRDLTAAQGSLDTASAHLSYDPLIRIAGLIPPLDGQIDAAHDLIDIASSLTQAGREATAAASKAVAVRDRPSNGEPLTASIKTVLERTAGDLDRMQRSVDEALARRNSLGDRKLWGPLAAARDRVDSELPGLINELEALRQADALIPSFMGFQGERRYLVLALNNGELLPGGGLVTAAGVMPVNNGVNGTLEFTDSTLWKEKAEALGIPYITPPGPLQRYLLRDYTWNLLVSNWNPDFPSWAQQAREFYELINGSQQIDGVIAVDLVVLERLMEFTGPKTLDAPGYGPVTFTRENVIFELERVTRPAFEPVTDDRKSLIGELAAQMMGDLLNLPSDEWGKAVQTVRNLGKEKHLQLLSYRAEEQTLLRDAGWDGRVEPITTGDYLQLNEASLHSTKLNLILKQEGSLAIDVDHFGRAVHELALQYVNPVTEWSKDKDADLVLRVAEGGLYGGYLRVFGPRGITEFEATIDGAPASIEDVGSDAGKDWFGTYMSLPRDTTRNVVMRWVSPPAPPPDDWDYGIVLEKQAGTSGLCLELSIVRDGQAPKVIDVRGGHRDERGRVCLSSDVEVRVVF